MKEKTKWLSLRLSEKDLETVRANAGMLGMSVSAYVRSRAVLGIEKVLYDPEARNCVFEIHKMFREACSLISGQIKAARENGFKDGSIIKTLEAGIRDMSSRLAALTDSLNGRQL